MSIRDRVRGNNASQALNLRDEGIAEIRYISSCCKTEVRFRGIGRAECETCGRDLNVPSVYGDLDYWGQPHVGRLFVPLGLEGTSTAAILAISYETHRSNFAERTGQ